MENSLQNIILEELENFEGIFIATTNMESNLDKAFDRRFLYKMNFDNPGMDAIRAIWKTKFPNLEQGFIDVLSKEFSLTGAQIENIRKKSLVDFLMNADLIPDLDYYRKLAQEEINFRNEGGKNRSKIGFNRLD
jgi:SpoVK/Ycf46/Vps4 family AAA+-type ATPase